MADQYHCFYTEPIGYHRRHEIHDALEQVLVLVKENANPESGKVRGLKVVYGELLEFEPCQIVESYRVKER